MAKTEPNEERSAEFDFSILRELRAQKKISLAALSEKTDVSYATLARIESNRFQPNLTTIRKLADFFQISPAHLLELASSFIVERFDETMVSLKGQSRRSVEFSEGEIRYGKGKAAKRWSRSHTHPGQYQITWVVKGRMAIRIHNEEHELKKGQAIKFDAGFLHSIRFLEDSQFIVALVPKRTR